jgi:hypothetical protein
MTGKLHLSRLAYVHEWVYRNWYLDFSNHVWDTIGNNSWISQDMTKSGNNVWSTPLQAWGVRMIWWNHFCCLNIVCMPEESSEMDNYRGENFKGPISFVEQANARFPDWLSGSNSPTFLCWHRLRIIKQWIQSVKAKKSSLITLCPTVWAPAISIGQTSFFFWSISQHGRWNDSAFYQHLWVRGFEKNKIKIKIYIYIKEESSDEVSC